MDVEAIRQDFPILSQGMIYLDNASTVLTPKPIIDKIADYYTYYRGNPSRSIHSFARKAEEKLVEARAISAKFINASPEEIVFTRNTTEGLNLIANGLKLEDKGNIVVTALEHHSNFLPWMRRCQREGREFRIVYPKKKDGTITLEDFMEQINNQTRLVALTHVSNTLGIILPVQEVVKVAHERNAYVVLDAAQSAPHMPINVKQSDVDFLALSGHKVCGPTSSGLLFIKKEYDNLVEPAYLGGGTVLNVEPSCFEYINPPSRFEAGTVAHCELMAMADAFEYVARVGLNNIFQHDRQLMKIGNQLLENVKGIKIYGPPVEDRTSIFAFNIEGIDPTEVAMILDSSNNIEVRSGHLCAQVFTKKVLGEPEGIVRASSYFYNTEKEMTMFAEAVKDIVDTMVS